MRCEVRRHARRAVLLQIARRRDDDLPDRADTRGDRRAFRQRADAHARRRTLPPPGRPAGRASVSAIDTSGIAAEKLHDDRQHMQPAEQDRRGDAQFAARRGPLPGGRSLDLVELGQHPTRAVRKRAPASVRLTARVVRLRSRTPRRASSSATARVTAAGERPSCRAASAKLPRSATSTKAATLSIRSILFLLSQ